MGRVSVLIGFVVAIVVVAAAGGYWYVKDHQRMTLSAVETKVASSEHAIGVACVEKAAHGRRWHCAGKVGSQGECYNVVVDWRGNATVKALKANRCTDDPALKAIVTG